MMSQRGIAPVETKKLKIVHVGFSDRDGAGGTGIALYGLHRGLIERGHQSKILSRMKSLRTEESEDIPRSVLELFLKKITTKIGLNGLEGVGSFSIRKHRFYKEADILHLHAIHSGYFNYLALPALTQGKPAVWTQHDLWGITGHCTYSYDCQRWRTGCGHCPYPKHYPAIQRDATALEWKLKKWSYGRSKMQIVVASKWFLGLLKDSLFSSFQCHHIPWGLNTEIYKPLDKGKCRSLLGIPEGKKVLMCSAVSFKLHNKGGDLLHEALKRMPESLKKDLLIMTLGHGGDTMFQDLGISTLNFGYVINDHFKAIVYSSADAYILPTRAETFSLVALESIACGVPVVSFDVGPLSELVRDRQTGLLARFEDTEDFAAKIVELMDDAGLRQTMNRRCREIALKEYSLELQTERYLEVYKNALGVSENIS